MHPQYEGQNRYQVVCRIADYLFHGGELSASERQEITIFLLAQTNRHKGFVFFPTPAERAAGIRLITGEKPRTLLLANNAVELETLRLLALLQPENPAVQTLINEASLRLEKQCFAGVCLVGECAGTSIAYLRYLTARGVENFRRDILHGLDMLRQDRTGSGRWRRFPTRFTRRWLAELPPSLTADEQVYAAQTERV